MGGREEMVGALVLPNRLKAQEVVVRVELPGPKGQPNYRATHLGPTLDEVNTPFLYRYEPVSWGVWGIVPPEMYKVGVSPEGNIIRNTFAE